MVTRFVVDIFENALYSIEVQAENEQDARALALRMQSAPIMALTREVQKVEQLASRGRPPAASTNGHSDKRSARTLGDTWCTEPGCTRPGPHKGSQGLQMHLSRSHKIYSDVPAAAARRGGRGGGKVTKKAAKKKTRRVVSPEHRAILVANAARARDAKAAKRENAKQKDETHEEAILRHLRKGPKTTAQLHTLLGDVPRQSVHSATSHMLKNGKIERVAKGEYALVTG